MLGDFIGLLVEALIPLCRTGDDERGSGFIDQDRVYFIDNDIVVLPLYLLFCTHFHVVTQVVKSVFIVGAVGDICIILSFALHFIINASNDTARGIAQEIIEHTHLSGIPACKVVIDGDHMHTVSSHSIECDCQSGDQCLALSRLHLSDIAVMQDHTSDKLYIEVTHTQHTLAGLSGDSKGVIQYRI